MEKYQKWLNSTPLIIPRKIQIKPILEEPEAQTKLRERMTEEKMRVETELLKPRAQTNQEKVKSINEEINKKLNKETHDPSQSVCACTWRERNVKYTLKHVKTRKQQIS